MILFERRKANVHIMDAVLEDCADMAEIHGASFPRPWSDGELAVLLSGKATRAWIARARGHGGDKAMGFALLRVAEDEAEIITIATAPRHRKRGVARMVMEHAIREIYRERVSRLLLEVDGSNFAAVRLYRSLGFHQISIRKAYYPAADRDDEAGRSTTTTGDALVMELELR